MLVGGHSHIRQITGSQLPLVESGNCFGGHDIFGILRHQLLWPQNQPVWRSLYSCLEQTCPQLLCPTPGSGLFPSLVRPTGSMVEGRPMRVNDFLRMELMAECLGKRSRCLVQEKPWSPSSPTILPQRHFVLSKILAPVRRAIAIRSSPGLTKFPTLAFYVLGLCISRIQTHGKSCTLHAQSFHLVGYLQKHLFNLLCHDSKPVYGVISVP